MHITREQKHTNIPHYMRLNVIETLCSKMRFDRGLHYTEEEDYERSSIIDSWVEPPNSSARNRQFFVLLLPGSASTNHHLIFVIVGIFTFNSIYGKNINVKSAIKSR